MFEKFEQKRHWSDNKDYLKLLKKVDKQLIINNILTQISLYGSVNFHFHDKIINECGCRYDKYNL